MAYPPPHRVWVPSSTTTSTSAKKTRRWSATEQVRRSGPVMCEDLDLDLYIISVQLLIVDPAHSFPDPTPQKSPCVSSYEFAQCAVAPPAPDLPHVITPVLPLSLPTVCCRTPNPSKDCIWDKRTLVLPCPELHNSDGSRQVGVGKCLALLMNPACLPVSLSPHAHPHCCWCAVRTYMVALTNPTCCSLASRSPSLLTVHVQSRPM